MRYAEEPKGWREVRPGADILEGGHVWDIRYRGGVYRLDTG